MQNINTFLIKINLITKSQYPFIKNILIISVFFLNTVVGHMHIYKPHEQNNFLDIFKKENNIKRLLVLLPFLT